MRMKVGNDYLDYDGSITVDRQAFTFEDISAYQGDRSYQFNLPKTTNNLSVLGIQTIDILTKTIYNRIECELFDDLNTCYRGYLRVEGVTATIDVAFVAGNYEWINSINSNIQDLYFSGYDVAINKSTILDSWSATGGQLVFPLVDNGCLTNRGNAKVFTMDFHPFIFAKDVMREIFQYHRFKLSGELLNDPLYNDIIVSSQYQTDAAREDIEARTAFVGITSSFNSLQSVLPMFDNSGSFYDGSANLWDNSTYFYTADYTMLLNVSVKAASTALGDWFVRVRTSAGIQIELNAVNDDAINESVQIVLEAGEDLFCAFNVTSGALSMNVCEVTITPLKVYKTYAKSLCGTMRSIDFVTNIFNIFNVVPEFDPVSKTITANLFKNIHTKPEVDLSQYFSRCTYDFKEFVSKGGFGKKSYLKYSSGETESVSEYNNDNEDEYASGFLSVNNDFISNTNTVVDINFDTSRMKYNSGFQMYLPSLNFIEFEEAESFEIISVIDNSGQARVETASGITTFMLGRVTGRNPVYNKDWLCDDEISPTGFTLVDSVYSGAARLSDISRLIHIDVETQGVSLLVYKPNVDFGDVSDLSSFELYESFNDSSPETITTSGYWSIGYAYFVKPETNAATNFPQTPAFGLPNEFTQYQLTAKDVYYKDVQNVLNDPVKVKAVMYLPYSVFLSLSSHVPYRLHTKDFNALFYLNKVSGYRGSQYPCTLELIKL